MRFRAWRVKSCPAGRAGAIWTHTHPVRVPFGLLHVFLGGNTLLPQPKLNGPSDPNSQ